MERIEKPSRATDIPPERDPLLAPEPTLDAPSEPESTTASTATTIGVFLWILLALAGSILLFAFLYAWAT